MCANLRRKLTTNMAPLITHSGALVSIKKAYAKQPFIFNGIVPPPTASDLLYACAYVLYMSSPRLRAPHARSVNAARRCDIIPWLRLAYIVQELQPDGDLCDVSRRSANYFGITRAWKQRRVVQGSYKSYSVRPLTFITSSCDLRFIVGLIASGIPTPDQANAATRVLQHRSVAVGPRQ